MHLDVVIVGHQSADHLDDAIGSLASVATVTVVDNASTDATADVARAHGVRVVVNEVNAGFAAAANQGAALGHEELILFLNPDASIALPDLARLVGRLDEQPRLAVVSPRIRYDDGAEQQVFWPFPSAGSAWREAFGLHQARRRRPPEGFVIGACFLMRRAAFEELGGFDTRYWLYGEETDLCRRALDAGWNVGVGEESWARHVGGASRATAPALVAEHFERGGERFVADREQVRGLVSYRLAKIVGSMIRVATPGSRERRALHRARLRRYLHTLRTRPTTVALDSPATRAPGHSLIVCSLEAWDEVWRRNQLLVRELLGRDPNLRVLFVEPPHDWVHEVRRRSGQPRRRGLRSVRADGRVLALQPGKVAPRLLGGFADRSLRRQVEHAAAALGFATPTLWINDAAFSGLLADPWPAVYDVTDDWSHAAGSRRARKRLQTNEDRLLERSAVVVVCSPDLAGSRRRRGVDLRVIPNGVDVDHFRRPQERPSDLPGAPVAVYVGTLHEDRLDVDLVERLARDLPTVQLTFVGPNALSPDSTARLTGYTNVHLLGARPYQHVPGYLQHADVVIVPHVVSAFTESLDPIKAYECLAVGRPTVATRVAGFRDLGAPIRAVERDRFGDAVTHALDNPGPDTPQDVASWSDRADEFAAALQRARDTAVQP